MKCYIHENREAMAICTGCGKFICEECHVEVDKKSTCVNCVKKELGAQEPTLKRKSVILLLLLSLMPFFPLGTNYLYLGKFKTAALVSLGSIVMFGYFRTILYMPFYFYGISIAWVRFLTFGHCFAVLKNRQPIFAYKFHVFVLSLVGIGLTLTTIGAVVFDMLVGPAFRLARIATISLGWGVNFGWGGSFTILGILLTAFVFVIATIAAMTNKNKIKSDRPVSLKHLEDIKDTKIEGPPKNQDAPQDDGPAVKLKQLAKDMEGKAFAFKKTSISAQVEELSTVTNKILAFIEKYPNKARSLGKFLDYYLPTTIKLLDNYQHLKDQNQEGANISRATEKIESLLEVLQNAFKTQLDVLFEDKAMDIDAEISVLTTIMTKEGLL